jgi:hypothetical protein
MNWPNWADESVIIVASGESAKKQNISLLKGKTKIIAIKKSFELVPFADAVYGCDGPWWRSVQFLPKFKGYKWAFEPTVCNSETGIVKVEIKDKLYDKLLFGQVGVVGSGGNSGFQALNLAVQFGAKRILLVGFDMQGEHWYGRNNWDQAGNPSIWNFPRWVRAFNNAAPQLAERGIEVFNASQVSELKCFRKRSIEETMQQWELLDAA